MINIEPGSFSTNLHISDIADAEVVPVIPHHTLREMFLCHHLSSFESVWLLLLIQALFASGMLSWDDYFSTSIVFHV